MLTWLRLAIIGKMAKKSKNKLKTAGDLKPKTKSKKVKDPTHVHVSFFITCIIRSSLRIWNRLKIRPKSKIILILKKSKYTPGSKQTSGIHISSSLAE